MHPAGPLEQKRFCAGATGIATISGRSSVHPKVFTDVERG